jgi:circadian clock protein KaiC
MTPQRTRIRTLPTGVPGLDEVLGGGLPEFSFSLIVGSPGTGKTTLAQQIVFRNASAERPALYFTVLGEPTVKLLRHQQQFRFFDAKRVGTAVRYLNLSDEVVQGRGDMSGVLERIVREVEATRPRIVVVDSFRSLERAHVEGAHLDSPLRIERFVQLLALHLTTWEVTALLVGEYSEPDTRSPLFTVADGIIWLSQEVDRSSAVRRIQVVKQRGVSPLLGMHTARMTADGLEVFPRPLSAAVAQPAAPAHRVHTGIPALDDMMGGGLVGGDALIVAGPTGVGKTTFGMHFIAEAVKNGGSAIVVVFEEPAAEFLTRASSLGFDLAGHVKADKLRVLFLRALDLSVDEAVFEIRRAVRETGANRVLIDSLSGFELALAPLFREDFRESVYRLVRAITGGGVTVMMTFEVLESAEMRIVPHHVSFLADDIVVLRYVELQGVLRTVLAVVKMRRSEHSHVLREFTITATGISIGRELRDYENIVTRSPHRSLVPLPGLPVGIASEEMNVLRALLRLGRATIDQIALEAEVPIETVANALVRLASLGYAEVTGDPASPSYRAIVLGEP